MYKKGKAYAGGTKFFIHKAKLVYKVSGKEQIVLPCVEFAVAERRKRVLENHPNYKYGTLEVVSLLKKNK